MFEKDTEARTNIIQSLTQLQAFNREVPNSMIVQFFLQTRVDELIGVFKNGSADVKLKALEILATLDASNMARYKEQLQ
jgi:hypothetical protein